MNLKTHSDHALLEKLIGKRALARYPNARLSDVFNEYHGHPRMRIARELVERLLYEQLEKVNVLSSPSHAREYLKVYFRMYESEAFVVLFMDAQHCLIASHELFRGSLTSTEVHPREIIKLALRYNAAAIILAHNHPSGCSEPSQADRVLTSRITETVAYIGVRVIDHLVIGSGEVMSFAERGML